MDDEMEVEAMLGSLSQDDRFYDDINGEELPRDLVIAARRLEIDYHNKRNVYSKVCWSESVRCTGKPPIKV